jgi:zinc protease
MNNPPIGILLRIFMSLFLVTAPSWGQLSLSYSQFTLPNGLHVILHQDHTLPITGVNIWYHVGSAREKVGKTGLAHLFEHLMFEGSVHVPVGRFDQWLEAAGGDNNASTTNDRTNYFEIIPSNALELPLFLESDRMASLVDSMTPAKVDIQREVVKNERRQSIENQPYGKAFMTIDENLFPADHPYHWDVIGSMEDLTSATYDDVVRFFKKYYSPANASLVITGDIDTGNARRMVEYWFRDVPAGPPVADISAPVPIPDSEKTIVLEDNVQLPRLYLTWITPRQFAPGNAEINLLSFIFAGGKNSRLYKRLVYDMQIAQDVTAFQDELELCSKFYIIATARSGHSLNELQDVIQQEIDRLKIEPPGPRELQRAVNLIEANYLDQLESIGQKADQMNEYYVMTGNPDYFNEDLSRYKAVDVQAISAMTRHYLRDNGRVVLSVVPEGKRDLAVRKKPTGK